MKGEKKLKDLITIVVHDPADRHADGRWEGTIVQKKVPVREIRWKGLNDQNSSYLRVTMTQDTRKYLRGTSQNIGNCLMVQKKELGEIF